MRSFAVALFVTWVIVDAFFLMGRLCFRDNSIFSIDTAWASNERLGRSKLHRSGN